MTTESHISPGRRLLFIAPAALVLAFLGFGLGYANDPGHAWGSLLIATFYFLTLSLGALFFVSLNHLVNAGWWVALRRIPEALASALPIMALPMLLLFFGRHELYHWTHADAVAHDPVLAKKAAFLNTPFFFGRMAVILLLWAIFAFAIRRLSLAERTEEGGARPALGRLSAIFIVLFAVTFSVASFDWLMSLEPHWFSTIFAVYTFAGLFLGAVAAIIVTVFALSGPLRRLGLLRREHLHDLGKLLFAFSTFWAYIWLSQYLLIWYGHLPEEITHYVTRSGEGWQPLFFLVLILNWVIPFLVLLPQATKRRPAVLFAMASVVLVGRWLDLYVHVMPTLGGGPSLKLSDLLLFLGFAGMFFFLACRGLAKAPLVPPQDSRLRESLSYSS